jgi:RNA polymerase sigma-70 factor (ECF subfamily)
MHEVERNVDLDEVERARTGDVQAFESLIQKYGREVYAVCRRFTHDAHEAEDLAQEALTRAYRGLKNFRAEASFHTWLFRIVMNVGRSWWKSRSSEPPLSLSVPEQARSADELLEAMRVEIARLPDRQREVLTLRVFGNLEFEEISSILEITPGAARVHLSLARKALAERMSMEDEL